MLLKVDYRETELLKLLSALVVKYERCSIESSNLPLGDIIICDDAGAEVIIVERKTLNDLAASIKDGRYTEQSYRLTNTSIHNHNIFYLIEGNIHTYKSYRYVTKETLLSAMTSLTYTKGFSVYRTLDSAESALWILQTADKLSRIKEPYYYANISPSSTDTIVSYNSVSKRVKKNNITPENINAIMLAQIPNVSTISADAIMLEYKTIDNLMDALKKDSKVLSKITTANSRKLSKLCINNICSFLLV